MWKNRCILAGAVSVALSTAAAQAAPIIYFGEDTPTGGSIPAGGNAETARNDFLAHLSGVGSEDFEGFATGSAAPLTLSFPGSAGNLEADLTGDGGIESGTSTGRFPTSGNQFYEVTGDFGIDFATPVAAFGFYGTDIGDFDGRLTVTLTDSNGVESVFEVAHTINQGNYDESLLFWGFIDSTMSYTSLTFGNTAPGVDYFGFDDMTIGDAEQIIPEDPTGVPAPGTLPLLLTGALGALAAWRRRRA